MLSISLRYRLCWPHSAIKKTSSSKKLSAAFIEKVQTGELFDGDEHWEGHGDKGRQLDDERWIATTCTTMYVIPSATTCTT